MIPETFGEMRDFVAERVGASRAADVARIDTYCEISLDKVWRRLKLPESRRETVIEATKSIEATVAATEGSKVVTLVSGDPFTAALVGMKMIVLGLAPYTVATYTDPNTIELSRAYFEESDTALEIIFYDDEIRLPDTVAEVIEDDIRLLVDEGDRVRWMDRTEGRSVAPWPSSSGQPNWVTPGKRVFDSSDVFVARTLRLGPVACDRAYPVEVPYHCRYPALPTTEVDRLAEKIHLPRERRDLATWHALASAYSEHPFTDQNQQERWESKYEREMDIALKALQDERTDVHYIEPGC